MVTFGDPENSRLQTSLHRNISLRIATGNPHPRTLRIRGFKSSKPVTRKNEPKWARFFLAGMEGLEPPNAGTKNQCLTTWRHPNIYCGDCILIKCATTGFWYWYL